MKKIIYSLLVISTFSVTSFAQNKNIQEEVKEKVIKVKDSEGEKTIIKKENTIKEQDIRFRNPDSGALNKEQIVTPIKVDKNVEVTIDGVKRYIDVDRSGKYESLGKTFYVTLDKKGYTVRNENGKTVANLRETESGNYIHADRSKVSNLTFDDAGNIVVETYDYKDDTFTKYFYKKVQ
nr:hypothetical protein [uncultured Flavobacterium sp.]